MSRSFTFGVELELIVCGIPEGEPIPNPQDTPQVAFPTSAVKDYADILEDNEYDADMDSGFANNGPCCQAIADVLCNAGIPAFPYFRARRSKWQAGEWELGGWEVKTDESIRVNEDEDTPFFKWDPNSQDYMDAFNPYQHHIIEIVSPVLRKGFTGNPLLDDADFEQVGRVANIIQTHFRAFCNRTTGLHVHVGNGLGRAFEISTMQKLMAFLWTFEPGIEKVHPPRRRDTGRKNAFCRPLRSQVHHQYTFRSSREMIDAIMSCTNIRQLGMLLARWGNTNTGRYGAYNIENLAHDFAWEMKKTMEFRQHAGTINPDKIKLWAKFCVQLVNYAMTAPPNGMVAMCYEEARKQVEQGTYTYIDEICSRVGFREGEDAWAMIQTGVEEDDDDDVGGEGPFMLPPAEDDDSE